MKQFYLILWDNLDSVYVINRFFTKDIFYPSCKEDNLLVEEEEQSIPEVNSLHLFSHLAFQTRINSKNF